VALNGAATSSTTGAYTLKSACWTAAACASTDSQSAISTKPSGLSSVSRRERPTALTPDASCRSAEGPAAGASGLGPLTDNYRPVTRAEPAEQVGPGQFYGAAVAPRGDAVTDPAPGPEQVEPIGVMSRVVPGVDVVLRPVSVRSRMGEDHRPALRVIDRSDVVGPRTLDAYSLGLRPGGSEVVQRLLGLTLPGPGDCQPHGHDVSDLLVGYRRQNRLPDTFRIRRTLAARPGLSEADQHDQRQAAPVDEIALPHWFPEIDRDDQPSCGAGTDADPAARPQTRSGFEGRKGQLESSSPSRSTSRSKGA